MQQFIIIPLGAGKSGIPENQYDSGGILGVGAGIYVFADDSF